MDRVLDDLGIYPGFCVHCYGKSGYDNHCMGIRDNYVPIIRLSKGTIPPGDAEDLRLLGQGRWGGDIGEEL